VAYQVQIPDPVRAYLNGLPLSDTAKGRVEDFIDYALAQVDDAFRTDPANRTQPNTAYFQRVLILHDVWGDGRYHHILFVVNDSWAACGVLILVFVDDKVV
jgi:hypothetical protein